MKRWLRGLLIGCAISVVGLLLFVTDSPETNSGLYYLAEARVGLYSLFHVRGKRTPPPEVAVVAINARTGEKLGLPPLPRDWPRTIHGKLVDELTRRGAKTIVFDFDFRRSRNEQHDLAFARSIAASGRVVLFEYLTGQFRPIEDAEGRTQRTIWMEELQQPIPVLTNAARALGSFPLPKLGAAVHQFWAFKESAGDSATMPVSALQVFSLPHYAQWRNLLSEAIPLPADRFPPAASDIGNAKQVKALMNATRHLFKKNPDLAQQVEATPAFSRASDSEARLFRALLSLYGGSDQPFLNYYGPPGTIPNVPYHAVIKGGDPNLAPDALDFTGKAVFVGYADLLNPGQEDRFFTVFTHDEGVDLSGVEIAATAFANLIENRTVKPVGAGVTLAVLFVFGMVMGALVYLAPAAIGVTLALVLAFAYAAAAQISFNHTGAWWPLVTPLLVQLPLALFIGLYAQYRLQHRRVQHVSEAIRKYVPENVSSVLTNAELKADDINKVTYGTCLATDMAGFSTIAEKMAPGDLAKFLNEYFDVLAQALKRHGVSVTEFRADAIMCAWTGAADDPRVRSLPVAAALDAAQAITAFNTQRGLQGSLRIGLADGEFYVGHAGGGGHFVYSIVGDCANTASRIENLNKHLGTRILTSGGVVRDQDDLLVRPLGRYRFVGKHEALPITEVVATKAAASVFQKELCTQFMPAFAAFEHGEWGQAVTLFDSLLREVPHDGPSRFLLERCKANLQPGATPDEPGVITMTAK